MFWRPRDGHQIAARFTLVLREASDLARFAPDQVRVLIPALARWAAELANPEWIRTEET